MNKDKLFNSSLELGLNRVRNSYKQKYDIWKTAVDYSVWVYFIIPIIGVMLYHYYNLWMGNLEWPLAINEFVVIIMSFLFVCLSQMKIYVEEGDQLVFLQRKSNLKSLFLLSYWHLIIKSLFLNGLFVILLFPLLIQYLTYTATEVMMIYCILSVVSLCTAVFNHKVYLTVKSIRLYILLACLYILIFLWMYAFYVYTINSFYIFLVQLLISLMVFLYLSYISIRDSKLSSTIFELNARYESMVLHFLLAKSAFIGAPEFVYTKKRAKKFRFLVVGKNSVFFKQNNKLNGMIEVVIKTLFRDHSWLMMYGQIIVAGVVSLWFVQGVWLKLIVLISFIAVLYQFAFVFWYRVFQHSFFELFSSVKLIGASKKGLYILMLPGTLFLSGFTGYHTYSFLGLLVSLVMGLFVMYTIIMTASNLTSRFLNKG
ncbi:ABC transporter permease [Halalkalibacillus halophilus]|uniref:ABC transporter permease n=1 Tax=Halalkalibacillus halophilus TaxID=392827 RepID=UPI0003F74CE1|nr:ABC transporter permease [Halalkalibacillus halophilus]